VTNFLLCLSEKVIFFFTFERYRIVDGESFIYFNTLDISLLYSCLNNNGLEGRSSGILILVRLQVTCDISLTSSTLFSLCLVSSTFNMLCLGFNFLGVFILLNVF
jgi:hypothetical protein